MTVVAGDVELPKQPLICGSCLVLVGRQGLFEELGLSVYLSWLAREAKSARWRSKDAYSLVRFAEILR